MRSLLGFDDYYVVIYAYVVSWYDDHVVRSFAGVGHHSEVVSLAGQSVWGVAF